VKRIPSVWLETTAIPSMAVLTDVAGPGWTLLTTCVMEEQLTMNWCWAAVAQAVEDHYGPRLSQCQVAGDFYDRDCCHGDNGCNRLEALMVVLDDRKRLAGVNAQIGFKEVVAQIDAKRPICCFINRPPLNHFVVINGYHKARKAVAIIDPDPALDHDPQELDFTAFKVGYGNGTWDNTYFTK
jgi:hypothetical protein